MAFEKFVKEKGTLSEDEFYFVLQKLPKGANEGDQAAWLDMEYVMMKLGYGPYGKGAWESTDVPLLYTALTKLKRVSSPEKLRKALPEINKVLEKSRTFKKLSSKVQHEFKEFFFQLTEEKIAASSVKR
jgi:hypothetical protein